MKRLLTITITLILLMLPVQTTAEDKGPLSYDRAVSLMNLNNSSLKKLQRAEAVAYKEYQSSLLEAGNIDVNGITTVFNGKEVYITYSAETRLAMTKQKELLPEQMKLSWESARDKRITAGNSLETSLRGVFLGLYNAKNDLQLKQKQLTLAADLNEQSKQRLEKGLITTLNMEESDYDHMKAQKDVDAANRNFDNAVRSFNQFVGLPAKTEYTQIIYEEELARPELKAVESYIDAALSNRSDISSIRKQLALKEHDKKLTETGYAYKTDTTAQDAYGRSLNDIEQLNVDLEEMGLTITNEIKNAYVDVASAGKGLDNMYNTVKLQRSNYEKMQARYKTGMISKNVLNQNELNLLQAENRYKAKLFDYNTKVTRFNNAAGIGPGY